MDLQYYVEGMPHVIQPTCSFIFSISIYWLIIPGTLLSIKKLTLDVTKPGGASDKSPPPVTET